MENLYLPGTILNARGQDWIFLPTREREVLRLRLPATSQADQIGRDLPLERDRVPPARFSDPDPANGGANRNVTLFDAARRGCRSVMRPFRLGRSVMIEAAVLDLNYLYRSA
jgi:hypothetical protein